MSLERVGGTRHSVPATADQVREGEGGGNESREGGGEHSFMISYIHDCVYNYMY